MVRAPYWQGGDRSCHRGAVFTGLVVILARAVLAASVASAATSAVPVRVEFSAPAGCSDADTFWAGIASRTEKARAARSGDAAMRLTVRLARAGAKVHGELRISVPGGHLEARRVDGATCAEVVQVLSLTAALAIDPSITTGITVAGPPGGSSSGTSSGGAAAGGSTSGGGAASEGGARPGATAGEANRGESAPPAPPPAGGAGPVPPPPPPAPPQPPPPPAVEPPPAELVRTPEPPAGPAPPWPARGPAVAASVTMAEVLASTLSVGGAVSGRLASAVRPRAPSLTGTFGWVSGDFFHSGHDLGVRWLAFSLDGCPGWRLGGFASIEPCARFTAGALTTTDHDVMSPKVVDRWWASGGAVAHVEVGRGEGFWLKVDVGLEIPFVKRKYVMTEPSNPLGSTASVYPTLAVGVAHSL